MLYIAHRINTINELKNIPTSWGVEIDLRDFGNNIILQHDPFVTSIEEVTTFRDWLKEYNHSMIILNIKSEGIEFRILELLKEHNITNYFFLDSSIPMINKLIKHGESNIAIRYSELEPVELLNNFRGKCKWLWVDCFTEYPKLSNDIIKDFKICLVSPSLQGRNYVELIRQLGHLRTYIDAICEKSYYIKTLQLIIESF